MSLPTSMRFRCAIHGDVKLRQYNVGSAEWEYYGCPECARRARVSVDAMPKTTSERDGEARIEGDQIIIRVRIANLQCIALGGWAAGYIEPIRIDDPAVFAAELCRALNDEAEDGTTPVHRLFDEAFTASIEHGAGEMIDDEQAEELLATFKETGGAA